MEGAITNLESLRAKFFRDGYAFWNLYYHDGKTMAAQNRKGGKGDLDDAWQLLQMNIEALNNPDGRQFKVQTFPSDASNHGFTVSIQIYKNPQGQGAAAVSGIGSLPMSGLGSIQEMIDTKLQIARLEWENESLQQALEANDQPSQFEKILANPAVQNIIAGLFNKQPGQMVAMPAMPVNGIPSQEVIEHPIEGDDDDLEIFKKEESADLLFETAQALGTDTDTLVSKLAALVQANPAMAKSLIA